MAEQPKKWWVRHRDPQPEEQTPESAVALDNLTKPELAAIAEDQGVDPSGTKAEIVERLTDG